MWDQDTSPLPVMTPEPSVGGTRVPILDRAALMGVVDGDRELLSELTDLLLADLPELRSAIQAASDAGDAWGLYRAAQRIRGAASDLCAPRAAAAAERLERMGRMRDLDGLSVVVEDLEVELEAFQAALRALRSAAKS
jgi:HPt (histidine-containing phosphotransfer) domain-containing protein